MRAQFITTHYNQKANTTKKKHNDNKGEEEAGKDGAGAMQTLCFCTAEHEDAGRRRSGHTDSRGEPEDKRGFVGTVGSSRRSFPGQPAGQPAG